MKRITNRLVSNIPPFARHRSQHHAPSWAILVVGLAAGCTASPGRDVEGACPANLLSGDLVITEIMADPAGADEGKEWFEVYNASSATRTLDGAVLVLGKIDGDSEKSHEVSSLTIEPGEYAVLGSVLNDDDIRPAWVDYGYGAALGSMNNTAGRVAILCGALVDEVTYGEPKSATSRGVDGSSPPDAMTNDDVALWCDASTSYEEGSYGTPGTPNDSCGGTTAPTECLDGESARAVRAPQAGDLVITEFHANPAAVADTAGEWFEIYVATDVDLNGLELGTDPADPSMTLASEECLSASAGSFVVFARSLEIETNGRLPQADHKFNFSLRNSGEGLLFVGRDGEVLDSITWSTSKSGAASNLDADSFDPVLNDDPERFCPATAMYGAGDLGSPGSENISCGPIVPTGQCNDGASSREVVPPNPGDLVITEFMADPSAVSDANGEWFEIYAASSFDLNGLEMGTVVGEVKRVVDDPECLRVEAGSYAVLANNGASEENGGLPAPITDVGFSLTNGASGIFVAHAGELLDAIAYSGTTAGVASALSSDSLSPEGNDDADNWCAATEIYGAGDRGTPGDANTTCGGGPSDGTCIGDDGPREIVRPQLGDLVITEFMANPTAVSDSAGEWFEVLATADVDLNGLAFGNEVGTVEGQLPVGGDCLHVAEDTRVVFARNGNSDMNGGLSAFATFSFSLIQDPSGIFLALPIQGTEDYETLDAITYTSTAAGASSSLDPDLENVTDNDNPANFCSATSVYNEPDLGTPGAENDPC